MSKITGGRLTAAHVIRRNRKIGRRAIALLSCSVLVLSTVMPATADITVSNFTELNAAIATVNAGGDSAINFANNITLTGELTAITKGVTITGNGHTLSGANTYRGLFIAAGSGQAVGISDLTIANGLGKGGNGGSGAGGGMGAGGGIFAMSGDITLTDVTFSGNAAQGGNGTSGLQGGGGGLGGNGGASGGPFTASGGGGGIGLGATGANLSGSANGEAGIVSGASGGGSGGSGGTGGANGGGGARGTSSSGAAAGGGGIGGVNGTAENGGQGGFGGGGGGLGSERAGSGGFGGGGGAGTFNPGIFAGSGGYGGGGGSAPNGYQGGGGFGGGSGNAGTGGGGMGAGGAIFICATAISAVCSATLTINNSATNTVDGTASGGGGANAGAGLGGALFLTSGAKANYSIASGTTTTVSSSIFGDGGDLGLAVSGGGTLALDSAANSFNGLSLTGAGTRVAIGADAALGSGSLSFANGTGLKFTATGTFSKALAATSSLTLDTEGNTVTYSGLISNGSSAGSVDVIGGGTLVLTNASNSYTGGTNVYGATTLQLSAVGQIGSGLLTLGMTGDSTTSFLSATQTFTLANAVTVGGDNHQAISVASTKVLTLSGILSGTQNLDLIAAGTLVLANAGNTYSGDIAFYNGAVLQGTTATIKASQVSGTGTLVFNQTTTGNFAGDVFSDALTITGNGGNVTLGGSNNISGTITVQGGATLTSATTLGSGNIILGDASNRGTLAATGSYALSSGTLTMNHGGGTIDVASGQTLTLSKEIVGNGVLIVSGAGELILSGANTYTGNTTLTGKLTVGSDGVINTSGALGLSTLTLNTGTLSTNAYNTIYNDIMVTVNGGTIDSGAHFFEVFGNIADVSTLGTLTITGTTNGIVFLGGTNSYSAATVVAAGATLQPAGNGGLSANSDYTINGTLNLRQTGGGDYTIKSLTGTGTVDNLLAGNSILVIATGSGQLATFAGQITDYGGGNPHIGIEIAGLGEQIFSNGANNYSGGTTITSGVLGIAHGHALGNGGLTIGGGMLRAEAATLTFNNGIIVNAAGQIDANGQTFTLAGNIADGASTTGALTLTDGIIIMSGDNHLFSGGVNVSANVNLMLAGANAGSAGVYAVEGHLQLDGNAISIGALTGGGMVENSHGFDSATLTLAAASGSAAFSGVINDTNAPLALVKNGAGTQTLSGNNSYTGGTSLNAGVLVAGSGTALGSEQITITGGVLGYANGVALDNAVEFQGDAVLNVAAGTATHSGDITDDGVGLYTVNKTGAGTLVLSGSNTFASTLRLAEGTLQIASQSALGDVTFLFDGGTLKAGGAFTFANDMQVLGGGIFDTGIYDTVLAGTLSDVGATGTLTIAGTGRVTISGINDLSGGAVIDADTVLAVAGASGLGAGDVSMVEGSAIHFITNSATFTNNFALDGDPIFDVATGLTTTLTGIISDAPSPALPGILEKTGAGTLVLAGTNTYSGGTILTDGALRVANDSALGSGLVTFDGGALESDGNHVLANDIAINGNDGRIALDGNMITLSGVISDDAGGGGNLDITSVDPGVLVLNGLNTYTGTTSIGGGVTVVAGTDTALGGSSVMLDGGTLMAASGSMLDIANAIGITASGATILANGEIFTLSGVIADSFVGGALTLGASGDTGTIILSGNNTYAGGTLIAGGTVQAGHDNAFGDVSGSVQMAGNTVLSYANGVTLANTLILGGAVVLNVDTGTATQDSDVLETGVSSLEKTGSGTLVLASGVNYSGATTISAGTLQIADSTATYYAGDYIVASGATLDFDGGLGFTYIGSLAGAGTVTAGLGTELFVGGAGDNNNSTTFSGILTADSLTYDSGGTLTLTGSANAVDQIYICACVVTGGITLSGGAMTSTAATVYGGTFTVTDGATFDAGLLDVRGIVVVNGGSTVTLSLAAVTGTATDAASLTISDASTFTVDNLLIVSGDPTWPSPVVTATGTGTVLSVTNSASLGFIGAGILTVTDGALFTTPNGVVLDNGSTLNIGTGAAAGIVDAPSITGLTGGEKIVANFTGDATLEAMLSGTLGLDVQKGYLTLNNALNDYSGGTSIGPDGVLILENSSAGTGAIANSGFLVIQNSAPSTFGYNMSGPGGLAQTGDGALTINTAQVYTGRTLIAPNSTLFLTGAGSLAASSSLELYGSLDVSGVTASNVAITKLYGDGDLGIGAKHLFIAGNGGVYSGMLSDGGAGGSLTLLGNQILNGVVSLTGTTTIGAGATLTVSGPNALGGGALNFLAGSTLKLGASGTYTNNMTFALGAPVFDVANQVVTFSGVLGGLGDLAVTGANGTLTLTNNANTYGDGTAIYGGSTLRASADGQLGGIAPLLLGNANTQGTFRYAGTFTLASGRGITVNAGGGVINTSGFDVTIGSAITGTGTLTKAGTGNLNLTGTSSFSGATSVTGGTLSVNGAIASSNVTVNNGGKLGGTGTVGGTTIASGGNLAPGNSIGTLTVNGNLTLAAGSAYTVEVSPTAADRVNVTGTATLNGTLALAPEAGTYGPATYRLVNAASVSGTFSAVTGSVAGFANTVQYSASGVDFILSSSAGPVPPVTTTFLFNTYGRTPNQVAAGAALTASASNDPLYVALGNVVTSGGNVSDALDSVSGEIHATLLASQLQSISLTRRAVTNRLRQDAGAAGLSLWGEVSGNWGSIDGDGNAARANRSGVNISIGGDTSLSANWRAGLEAGYSQSNVNVLARSSSAKVQSGHVGTYASGQYDALRLRSGFLYGFGTADTSRGVNFTSFNNAAIASQDASSLQLFGEAGYRTQWSNISLEPFVGMTWSRVALGAFSETGGASALGGAARSAEEGYFTLGLDADTSGFDFAGGVVTLGMRAAWQHGLNNDLADRSVSYLSNGQGFMVRGTPMDGDRALIDLDASLALSGNTKVTVGYAGSLSARAQDHAVRLMVSVGL